MPIQFQKDHPNKYRITYLPQEPDEDPELTVMETVFNSDAPIIRINLEYENALDSTFREL